MKHNKNKGSISLLIIVTLVIIGLYTIVLAEITSTTLHQTNQILLDAKNFNLQQSALAFVNSRETPGESVEIKLNDDIFRNCSINIKREDNSITIHTNCSIGRQKRSDSYTISAGKQ